MYESDISDNPPSTPRLIQLNSQIQAQPYSPKSSAIYLQRSLQHELLADTQSAIVDISKSLFIQPSCEGYLRRGRLYAKSGEFYNAVMDVEQAKRMYQGDEVTEAGTKQMEEEDIEEFMSGATVVKKLPEIKMLARKYECKKEAIKPEVRDQITRMMEQMLAKQQKQNKQRQQRQLAYIETIKKLLQTQQALILQNSQPRNEENAKESIIELERRFYTQVQQTIYSGVDRKKCHSYFQSVVKEIERCYLAATVLQKFDQKIPFEDFEIERQKRMQQKVGSFTKNIYEKVWKLFDKHQNKIQRYGETFKDLPYIGLTFKIIKASFKVLGWAENCKIESECNNITKVASNITSLNILSVKLSYLMFKHFQENILSLAEVEVYKKNYWQKVQKAIHTFQRNQVSRSIYKETIIQQFDYAAEMGKVHASILMAGIAYGIFELPKPHKMDGKGWEKEVFKKVAQIQAKMLGEQSQIIDDNIKSAELKAIKGKSSCNIY